MQELKGVKPEEGVAYREEPEVVKSYGDTVPIEDIGKIANLQGSEALRIEFPTEEGPMVVLLAGDEISFKGRRKDEEGQPYYSYTYRVRTDEGTYKGELRIYRNEDGRPYIEFHSDKGTFTYLPVKKEEGWLLASHEVSTSLQKGGLSVKESPSIGAVVHQKGEDISRKVEEELAGSMKDFIPKKV